MTEVLILLEVTLNGLMAGILYSLVALGFVLIFKASGVFNYAQGVMALFAAMTLVGLQTGQVPFPHLIRAITGHEVDHFGWTMPSVLAIILTIAIMVLFAWLVERLILRHLVNQEPIILFMATIGLAFFMEGFGDLMWTSQIKTLDVGIQQGIVETLDEATFNAFGYGMYIDKLDVTATIVAALLVIGLMIFSQYTRVGRALRAVADDHQAALLGRHLAPRHLGHRLVDRRHGGAGRRHRLGLEVGRAVLAQS